MKGEPFTQVGNASQPLNSCSGFLCREEEDGQWKEEQKLEAHSDWVRDVAWAPSIGLPTSTIASCSQVSNP